MLNLVTIYLKMDHLSAAPSFKMFIFLGKEAKWNNLHESDQQVCGCLVFWGFLMLKEQI